MARLYKVSCWPSERKHLQDLSGLNEDIRQGRDYGLSEVCDFQAKKRETGRDFGFEGQRWFKKKVGNQPLTFYTLPGRDARTKAIYTSTINRQETEIQICLTSRIHELVHSTMKEWGKFSIDQMEDPTNGTMCSIFTLNDEEIKEIWLNAKGTWNDCCHLFSSKDFAIENSCIEIKGKVDEGGNHNNVNFLKTIFYIPYPLLNAKILKLRKGEILRDPDTWQGRREDTLDDYLPH